MTQPSFQELIPFVLFLNHAEHLASISSALGTNLDHEGKQGIGSCKRLAPMLVREQGKTKEVLRLRNKCREVIIQMVKVHQLMCIPGIPITAQCTCV
jgi:hypothetical protein